MAPPSRLTPAICGLLVAALGAGTPVREDPGVVGVSERCVYGWLTRNPALRQLVNQERAEREIRLLGEVTARADDGEWKAAAFLLERLFPERLAPARARSSP